MCDTEDFLENARKSFRLAGASDKAEYIEHHSSMGRDYLKLAHDAAKLQTEDAPESLRLNGRAHG